MTEHPQPNPPAPPAPEAARPLLIDTPIEGLSQDSLALARYANALAEFIEGCDTPVTIGIQGDWGIGKTSLLRMLEELLSPRRGRRFQTPTLYLNTWQYAQFKQEEFLAISILNGIVREIEARFSDRARDEALQLRRAGAKLARFVGAIASATIENQTGVGISAGISALKSSETGTSTDSSDVADLLQTYRTRFANLVSKVLQGPRDKLVVMIDDLDRVRPGRALELLESIKNFADVPGCVFVLAVDYGVIQQGVSDRLGAAAQLTHGKSYFDKIIQVPFNMPVSAYQLDNYILSLLGWKFDGDRAQIMEDAFLPAPARDAAEHRQFFERMTRFSAGSNPRAIKRVVNYVKLLRLVRDEGARAATVGSGRGASDRRWDVQSAKILYALACMQIEWPEVFACFVKSPSPSFLKRFESWEQVSEMPELRGMWARYSDRDHARSNLLGFFDELIAIIDEDGNGEIAVEEFRPVWTILRDAQLTNVDLPDSSRLWKPMEDLLQGALGQYAAGAALVDALRSSAWNNPVHLRVRRAGRRYVNLLWDEVPIGSLVTAKRYPLQMYVAVRDPARFLGANPGLSDAAEAAEGGHFGIGNLEVLPERLADLPPDRQRTFLDRLHAALAADRSSPPPST